MAGWWTGASKPRLEVAEAALLKQYGQVCREHDPGHLADHRDQGCLPIHKDEQTSSFI